MTLMPTFFAAPSLVRRIEAAEADLAASTARVAQASGQPSFVLSVAGGLSVFARPGSPVNKCVGAGLGRAIDLDELEAAEAALARQGEALRIELSTLADPSVPRLLTERGYRLEGFENVLGLSLPSWDDEADSPDVAVLPVDELKPWADVLVEGFASPDDSPVPGETFPRSVLEEVMGDFLRLDGLRRYLARAEGAYAGGASLRVHDGVAMLCGASTLPAARRRGVQTALLRARLRDAKEAGAEVAVVTTAPGSRSQANVARRGFTLLYARAILVKPL